MREVPVVLLALFVAVLASALTSRVDGAGRSVFGFECASKDALRDESVLHLVHEALNQARQEGVHDWGDRAVTADLNGKDPSELFVPLSCGATCNCDWGVYGVAPARALGTVSACVLRVKPSRSALSTLLAFQHSSAMDGELVTYTFDGSAYQVASSRHVSTKQAIKELGCSGGETCCK